MSRNVRSCRKGHIGCFEKRLSCMKVKKVVPCLFIFLRKLKTTEFKWRQKPNNVNMYNLKMGTWDFGKPSQISWFFQHIKTLSYSTFSALPHQPGTTNISFHFPHFLNNQTNPKCNISKPTKHTHIFSFFSCFLGNQTGSIN